jgi:hypothetical protein
MHTVFHHLFSSSSIFLSLSKTCSKAARNGYTLKRKQATNTDVMKKSPLCSTTTKTLTRKYDRDLSLLTRLEPHRLFITRSV